VAVPPGPPTAPSASVPTCYRHPGRETYVSCVRCGRHACPDCLRSAAVGQQCVDCVREGNRGSRSPVTVFGGRPTAGAAVTWALVAINVLIYLVVLGNPNVGNDLGMLGIGRFTTNGPLVGVAEGQWYRLITAAFVAPTGLGFLDILFNMWALIVLGPPLERLFGHLRYLAIYLVSGLGGSVVLLLIEPHELALGASGAIFGLFGGWIVVSRRLRLDVRWIVGLLVLNFVIDFAGRNFIAWQAHVGGIIVGGLLTAAYAYAPRVRRPLIQGGATAVLVALLIVAVVIRDHQLASAALS
jgi:membrane associated rhomboid family serine protease